jgi:hypothetical protein
MCRPFRRPECAARIPGTPLTGLLCNDLRFLGLPPPQRAQKRYVLGTPVPPWARICRPCGAGDACKTLRAWAISQASALGWILPPIQTDPHQFRCAKVRSVGAKRLGALVARADGSQVIVTVNSGGVTVREIDLQRVVSHGFGGAGGGARFEHRQGGT